MNPLQQAIKDKVVDPALKDRKHMVHGVVRFYDNHSNRATVEINNPYGTGRRMLDAVPVQIGSGGVHAAGPFEGDEVWVTFLGGNILYPRITAMGDPTYEDTTREARLRHRRKGALVPDSLTRW